EFSADIYILKPRDSAKGNHAVFVEIPNRGGKGMLGVLDRATGSLNPKAASDFGDGFLLEQGYTLVWIGWQFDVPERAGVMRLYAPVATDHGKTITGPVRSEFIPDRKTMSMPLSDRNHWTYPVVQAGDLTVRDTVTGPRRTIPRAEWRVAGDHLTSTAGFEPGRIYEFIYTSKDPVVIGLGLAAVRDVVSMFKYGSGEFPLGDQSKYIKRAYGFGISQSARFLRKFVYDGFNADENDREVFDGILAHVAGGGVGSFNQRFGQPSRDGHPFLNTLYPTDVFPFTDLDETDPTTGKTDGILDKAEKSKTVPKIFYSYSSYEYWGRSAALIHSSLDGRKDAQIPDTTRVYFFAGGQHGPAAFPPPRRDTQNPSSPVAYTWSLRALLTAMDDWVKSGKEPPQSQYPKVSQDNLVPLGAVQFPKIAGVNVPAIAHRAYDLDFSAEPPKVLTTLPLMLPQVDRDGIDVGGIRMPEVAVPLATYTGWNLRSAAIGSPDELYSMQGSFLPFPRTKAEREASHDPRLSIEERYPDKQAYMEKVNAAAKKLVSAGYLLERDVPKVVERSSAEWDYLMSAERK
ncbi:MAG: hypothetical protein JWO80_1304, partial [Bryobacterales bacterium]|nr:hypothetical protein [Bryobacterales bacterium]